MGRCYPHLSLEDRRKIAKWFDDKMSVPEIADRLCRAPSTIYRELKRNSYHDDEIPQLNGYHALVAHDGYEKRRALHRKLIICPELKAAVRSDLDAGWSPEQIADRMKLERHPQRVSHETIYRYAYSKDGRGGILSAPARAAKAPQTAWLQTLSTHQHPRRTELF